MPRLPYDRRPVPTAYDRDYFTKEFQSVQAALPPARFKVVRAAYTADSTDRLILADGTTAAFTVTLPSASRVQGMEVTIKKTDVSANAITVGGTVDGAVNPTLATQYKAMTVVSDGASWHKIASI